MGLQAGTFFQFWWQMSTKWVMKVFYILYSKLITLFKMLVSINDILNVNLFNVMSLKTENYEPSLNFSLA